MSDGLSEIALEESGVPMGHAWPYARTLPKEPDAMGVWSDEDATVWLPRSLYPKRIEAIRWAMEQWSCRFLDVRCLSRWMRFQARDWEEWWIECGRDEPGAFRVWRLEAK